MTKNIFCLDSTYIFSSHSCWFIVLIRIFLWPHSVACVIPKNAACHSLKSANASKSVKSEKGERDSTPVSVCVGAALQ